MNVKVRAETAAGGGGIAGFGGESARCLVEHPEDVVERGGVRRVLEAREERHVDCCFFFCCVFDGF